MAKVTQAGLAIALYSENKNINHEEFVERFLKVFPDQSALIAALYWQNKTRRAKFGLAPIKLPSIYKEAKTGKPAKVKKEPKAKVEKPAKKIKVKAEPKVESKNLSDDEVAKIKAANLKKMKEITAKQKYLPGQVAKPQQGNGDGPVRTRADAAKWIKAEEKRIDEEMRERDYPKFLSKDQAKLLVG